MGWFERYTLLCVVLVIASLSLILIGSVQLLHRLDDRINGDSRALLDELHAVRMEQEATQPLPDVWPRSEPLLAIVVRSVKGNHLLRKTIRHTWAQEDYRVVHRFVLVAPTTSSEPDEKQPPKIGTWLGRLNRRGVIQNAHYFLFVDETVFVNTRVLKEALERTLPTRELVLCVPRESSDPFDYTAPTCDLSLPVLLSGDVVRNRGTGKALPSIHDAERLHLSRRDTEALLQQHQQHIVDGMRLVYFFSAPLDLCSSIPLTTARMIERLWGFTNGNFSSVDA